MSKYIIRMRNENQFDCNVYSDKFGLIAWTEPSKYLAIKSVIDCVKALTGNNIRREDIFTDWVSTSVDEKNPARKGKRPVPKKRPVYVNPNKDWKEAYDETVHGNYPISLPGTLSFAGYTEKALSTSLNLDRDDITYPVLGLAGESGEVAEKVKKIIRDKGGIMTDDDRLSIAVECGDVLWYINRMAWSLGYSLEEIAKMNIDKLKSRQKRGVLCGSGDNR